MPISCLLLPHGAACDAAFLAAATLTNRAVSGGSRFPSQPICSGDCFFTTVHIFTPENEVKVETPKSTISVYKPYPSERNRIAGSDAQVNTAQISLASAVGWFGCAPYRNKCKPSSTSLYTRIGSDRGNPQSTIMYRIQNIHTHSNGTTAPSRKSFSAHFAKPSSTLLKETGKEQFSIVLLFVVVALVSVTRVLFS